MGLKTFKKPVLCKYKAPTLKDFMNLRESAYQSHIDQNIRNRFENKHL